MVWESLCAVWAAGAFILALAERPKSLVIVGTITYSGSGKRFQELPCSVDVPDILGPAKTYKMGLS